MCPQRRDTRVREGRKRPRQGAKSGEGLRAGVPKAKEEKTREDGVAPIPSPAIFYLPQISPDVISEAVD